MTLLATPGRFLRSSTIMICNYVLLIVHGVNQLCALLLIFIPGEGSLLILLFLRFLPFLIPLKCCYGDNAVDVVQYELR